MFELYEKYLNEIKDGDNPSYMFNTINTSLLVKIVKKKIDPVALAKNTLRGRGLDDNGKWVKGMDKEYNKV